MRGVLRPQELRAGVSGRGFRVWGSIGLRIKVSDLWSWVWGSGFRAECWAWELETLEGAKP